MLGGFLTNCCVEVSSLATVRAESYSFDDDSASNWFFVLPLVDYA